MTSKLFSRFLRGERGTISVESVLAFPMLIWILTAMFVFFDAFKTYNVSQKAAYSVADMLSREEVTIGPDYLVRLSAVFDWLSHSEGDNSIIVSVVERKIDEDTGIEYLELAWSRTGDGSMGHANLTPIENRIPTLSLGEQVIIVEAFQAWSPAFQVGLPDFNFRQIAIQRPRFDPKLRYDPGVTYTG